jgi:hypothetical protein
VSRIQARRRRTGWAFTIIGLGVILVALGMLRGVPDEEVNASEPPEVVVTDSPTPSAPPPPPLQMPGDFAKSGAGKFVIAKTGGPLLGTAGSLKRFRIAVEAEAAQEIDVFTQMVDQTLGDSRSWIAGKAVRFQRVAEGSSYDFTIYLVTRDTAYKMCGISGLDIRVDGVPYTSCRQVRQVIINLDRWRLSVPDFVNGATPLEVYRQYVINHEVGHELGRGHESCPGPGKLAPTMYRQTLGLHGCLANPWPYVDGKRYAGDPVP